MRKTVAQSPPAISPELAQFISIVEKATAFDFVVAQRSRLADVNAKLQVLTKSSSKKDSQVVSQYLGMRTELQRSIDMVLARHAEVK